MSLNKIYLEKDGLVVGSGQLTASGGGITANNLVANGNTTITGNLLVSGRVAGNLIATGTIIDSAGSVRSVVQNIQTAAYQLVATDVGTCINITIGGVTIPSSVFSAGDTINIYNNSSASQSIIPGNTNVTMYWAGTSSTGIRTLLQRGLATIMCVDVNTFVITGAGVV